MHNLVDGKNFTCDDMHAWLAPFEPGDDHFVHVIFDEEISISLIRIWNYNKNRIHACVAFASLCVVVVCAQLHTA